MNTRESKKSVRPSKRRRNSRAAGLENLERRKLLAADIMVIEEMSAAPSEPQAIIASTDAVSATPKSRSDLISASVGQDRPWQGDGDNDGP